MRRSKVAIQVRLPPDTIQTLRRWSREGKIESMGAFSRRAVVEKVNQHKSYLDRGDTHEDG